MRRFACFLLILLLAACGGSPESTGDAPATAVVTDQPTATHTAVPTNTAVPPTATPTTIPTATATQPPPVPQFTFVGEDPAMPIVTNNPTAVIDNSYINPGGVAYHDGTFHMIFNSFTQWPGLVQFGYLTSTDGINWQAAQDEPLFTSDDIPFVRQGADVSSLVVDDNSQWTLYFHTVNEGSLAAVIGRATAETPLGPWTIDPQPVLSSGERGEWDGNGIAWPSVVKTDEGYAMYFAGTNNRRVTRIGLATSADGITWEKYNDPATEDAEFASSDPVLAATQEWEEGSIDRMRVVNTPEGFIMIYQGGPLVHRGLAFSNDGIQWTTHPDNPIITSDDFPIFGTTWDTNLVYADGTYYYFLEIGTMAGTDLYLASHTGNLR